MCGIAGFIGGGFEVEKRRLILENLVGALTHRGPDGKGFYVGDNVGLTHARLSIIDLSAAGNQPMYNEDNTVVLVCNGEIYNYLEVRADLEKRHQFASHSDCEVILHLYEENRDNIGKVLERLTGMFAFAIYDSSRDKLIVARDRIGIKPLYYTIQNNCFLFASEVKPLTHSGFGSYTRDLTSVFEYFTYGTIPGPDSYYNEIKCLEPGHYLEYQQGKAKFSRYYDIPLCTNYSYDKKKFDEELEALFATVVKDHLIADVPVGTFLSAGVDSSLITAFAVESHPGINTFTAAFPGADEDEDIIASMTAARLKTTHHSYQLTSNFFDDFENQFVNMDQPYADKSSLSLGRISKMARQHVKVVLSGDGSDELFGGYNRHDFAQYPGFFKLIPQLLQNTVLKIGAIATGNKGLETLRKELLKTKGQIFSSKVAFDASFDVQSLFSNEFKSKVEMQRYIRNVDRLFDSRSDIDRLNQLLYVDMKTTLINEMLTKADRMTMMNGIEGRVPFLDHRMVEFAFRVPGALKRQNGVGKLIVRDLLEKKLGKELAYRKKTGFNSPLKSWLESDEKSISYVRAQLVKAGRIPYLNEEMITKISGNLSGYRSDIIYALVFLGCFGDN